jgi:integrase
VLDARESRIRAEAEASVRNGRRLTNLPAAHHAFIDHVKPAILLLLNSGLRRSEIMRLEWKSVDFKARTITVAPATSKVKRSRVIPMNAEAYLHVPTGELWPASSVNAKPPPMKVGGDRYIKASAWLDEHRAVMQIVWTPGEQH